MCVICGADLGFAAATSPTTTTSATGDARIDALLHTVRWSASSLSYSFPDAVSDFGSVTANALNGFAPLNAAQMRVFHDYLGGNATFAISAFTQLRFEFIDGGSGAGVLRGANSSHPATAYAYYPSAHALGGDSFYGPSGRNPTLGNYDHYTILHELGHALGLKHPHEANATFSAQAIAWDSHEFSVMSYPSYVGRSPGLGASNEAFGYAQTYMMLDIAALQHLYGANYAVNAGDTVYAWTPTSGRMTVDGATALDPGANRIFATIWDGGGIDTYDLSAYAAALAIDLAPGGHSKFSQTQTADLGWDSATATRQYARGNVFNALLHRDDARSLIENAIGGSAADTILGNAAHNLLDGGGGADTLRGGLGDDTLRGAAGADSLDGGAGADELDGGTEADALAGGAGDDLYRVGQAGDLVIETDGAGFDTVVARASYAMPDHVERLELDGDGLTATGSARADVLVARGRDARLIGQDGADRLDGGQGADTLEGGADADTLRGAEGADLLDGGAAADVIEGGAEADTLRGAEGADLLDGGGADDVLEGGADADTLRGAEGADLLDGGAADDVIDGGSGLDTLQGGSGADTLDGGADGDALAGGAGDDLYLVDDADDLATETADGGTDHVRAWRDWTLAAFLEDLTLEGAARAGAGNGLDNRIVGTQGDDELAGLGGADTLAGGDGADTLDGGIGADRLEGGAGDDLYRVDDAGDHVLEPEAGGRDAIEAALSWTLAAGVEDLRLVGAARTGAGNDAANVLRGSDGANGLFGLGGADTLEGGAGADTLDGGAGADRLIGGTGDDHYELRDAADRVMEAAGGGRDVVRASVSLALADQVDTLVLVGTADGWGRGNALDNRLVGGGRRDDLSGLDGAETIEGGAGDDALSGGLGDDRLVGGAGADRLIGGAGRDALIGGTGADVFVFRLAADIGFGARADRVSGETGAAAFEGAGARGGDVIDLSGIDARIGARGDQAFRLDGDTGAGRIWLFDRDGSTVLRGDDGGGGARGYAFELVLGDGRDVRARDYAAGDFLL